jgi:hypothetical protein
VHDLRPEGQTASFPRAVAFADSSYINTFGNELAPAAVPTGPA